jgi:hypothetical protein
MKTEKLNCIACGVPGCDGKAGCDYYEYESKPSFTFDPVKHVYKMGDRPMTGVTTILNVIAKPSLIQWAANMACDYIDKNLFKTKQNVIDLGEEDVCLWIDSVLKEARVAHRKSKESAGDIGTEFHAWVEVYTTTNVCPPMPEDPKAKKMAENFHNWVVANGVHFIESEKKVYHADPDKWYAGTLDFTCEIKGKKYIGDLKTSSGIYDRTYFFQCAGYRHALEHLGDKTEYEGSVIVRCGKKGDFEEKYSYDYESDLKGFLACLQLYRSLGTFN